MFTALKEDVRESNKKDLLASPLLARATLSDDSGRCVIVAVFALSTQYEFYWVFEAKSARSPRRTWRKANYFPRIHPTNLTLEEFAHYYAGLRRLRVVNVKRRAVGKLRRVYEKQEHTSIGFRWEPTRATTADDFKLVRKINASAFRRGA